MPRLKDSPPRTPTWYARPEARTWRCPPAPTDVAAFHRSLPGYAPTPLLETPALASELGVAHVFVKDESSRLGLPAFKILGASWGVYRALCRHHDVPPDGDLARLTDLPPVRLITATDGNHGRAVAAMARRLGLDSLIYVPNGVHPEARAAIEAEGATLVTLNTTYDKAVRHAASTAGPSDLLVQDTAWPGYEDVPRWIVEGYSTLFAEIDAQLGTAASLIAVPVGVGSLAQAAVTHYRSGPFAPTLLSVEPRSAACVLTALHNDHPTTIPTGATIMAGLNCATPSSIAWPYLRNGLDAAVAITDADAVRAAHDLAALGVPAGPCGAASLAGVRAALQNGLSLPLSSTLILLSTEGTTANPSA
ncbi:MULTISPECIES: pyridoxal-phosphate dependent enzyme [Actinomadura]|uniref:Pyridoxal-phosphate dependent enzyme n=1 Tax=Actinomadura yumaensis TaxID=111807 RepID=A0ABW2CVJ7_9ACTN|nr:pyridoxal-phosphate dependent enzyme [Actinomadura sp. J1-007]MWK35345.1 pyridoxal-phosphate dependent enzyme [Actinomadura sp. J1-007]